MKSLQPSYKTVLSLNHYLLDFNVHINLSVILTYRFWFRDFGWGPRICIYFKLPGDAQDTFAGLACIGTVAVFLCAWEADVKILLLVSIFGARCQAFHASHLLLLKWKHSSEGQQVHREQWTGDNFRMCNTRAIRAQGKRVTPKGKGNRKSNSCWRWKGSSKRQ